MSYFSNPERMKAIAMALQEDKAMALNLAPASDTTNAKENTMASKTAPAAKAGEFQKFKGIPLPEARSSRESKYGWDELEIDESFFVPGAKPDTFNTLTSTRNKREKEKNGEKAKKFVARKFTHEGVAGVMVWRVE